jgi:hypothetical protein
MATLVCRNCHSVNQDPGGDPRLYTCGVCGQPQLERTQGAVSQTTATAIAGAAIGGMFGGPVGALFGALAGIVVGEIAEKRK